MVSSFRSEVNVIIYQVWLNCPFSFTEAHLPIDLIYTQYKWNHVIHSNKLLTQQNIYRKLQYSRWIFRCFTFWYICKSNRFGFILKPFGKKSKTIIMSHNLFINQTNISLSLAKDGLSISWIKSIILCDK